MSEQVLKCDRCKASYLSSYAHKCRVANGTISRTNATQSVIPHYGEMRLGQDFDGAFYKRELDQKRLSGQILRVYEIISDGKARTVSKIREEILEKFGKDDPENSIQAELRNLRKDKFGGHAIRTWRVRDTGLFYYQMEKNCG
ncbi:MAG: hypothetical protein ACYCQJ_16140 [Nitrososphaerales archaeon]